jgi:hypothetical protein
MQAYVMHEISFAAMAAVCGSRAVAVRGGAPAEVLQVGQGWRSGPGAVKPPKPT